MNYIQKEQLTQKKGKYFTGMKGSSFQKLKRLPHTEGRCTGTVVDLELFVSIRPRSHWSLYVLVCHVSCTWKAETAECRLHTENHQKL